MGVASCAGRETERGVEDGRARVMTVHLDWYASTGLEMLSEKKERGFANLVSCSYMLSLFFNAQRMYAACVIVVSLALSCSEG